MSVHLKKKTFCLWICSSDINECLTGNGGCEQSCNNFPGKFSCGCYRGFAWQPVMKAGAKVKKNGNTVAHIGHPFIFFTLYICNSNFNRKNPSCVRFKICNSNFNRRNSSCVHFKICNSNFNRRNSSCVRFKICNSNFNRRNSSCVRFKICNSNFNRRNSSCVHF